MNKGKFIVIEGTDCSGKETQTNLLLSRLQQDGVKVEKVTFPMYDTPTGRIVCGPYLGKKSVCDGYFEEGAANVDPKVAALYFVADRIYNKDKITNLINNGTNVLSDRYIESNMAHQGGKILDKEKRFEMYKWLEELEYGLGDLPKPDATVLLYVPYQYALELKKNREELPDQHETSEEHLKNAEEAYLELANRNSHIIINCVDNNKMRSIEDIHEEIYNKVISKLLR